MKKRTKHSLNKVIKITLIVVLLTISLNIERNYTALEIKAKDLASNITKLFSYPITEETSQMDSYLIQKNLNNSLTQEIKELKELLDLNSTLTEFSSINATIISRTQEYWLNRITIDKGANDGIKVGNAVITTNGLIGKVSKTTKTTSEVKLLTTDDVTYKTSVLIQINGRDHYAILSGYSKEENYLKVSAIDKNTPVEKGDIVITSGLGEMPRGLYIGTVVKTEIDNYNLGKIIYITPMQDFSNIHYVTVLKEKENV